MGNRTNSNQTGPDNSGALLSCCAGAIIGAAGLAWWLLSEAQIRREKRLLAHGGRHPGENRKVSPTKAWVPPAQHGASLGDSEPGPDLQQRVHELNQAIEGVRSQLEAMATPGR